MKLLKSITYLFIATLILASCSSDDDNVNNEPLGDYENGILITNEGPFQNGSGTISFISEDFNNTDHTIYNDVNNMDLGSIVQSMGFHGSDAYIVVNNSHKIEVVNRYTFEAIATISEGLNNPRYFVSIGDKGYVSNWGDPFDNNDDFIAIIDLQTKTVDATISVDFGPEKLIVKGEKIYIAHKGGFGQNNIVSIINTTTNSFVTSVVVGDVPNSMVVSRDDLWVLCEGNPEFTGNETQGSLVKIDTNTDNVTQTFDFETTEHPSNLTMDDVNLIYNLNGSVYSKEETSVELPSTSIIDGFFYTMTAKNGLLYATDAGDFASNGTLKVFNLSDNSEVESIEVGIIPGGIYFNN